MKRRNFVASIGTLIAASGAALGTGAFSTVSANRSFSVSTTGDSSALLSLSEGPGAAAGDVVSTSSENSSRLVFEFKNLNDDALTTFDEILTVTNLSSNKLGITTLRFVPEDASGSAVTTTDANGNFKYPVGVYKNNEVAGQTPEEDPLSDSYDRNSDVTSTLEAFPGSGSGDHLNPGESVDVGFLIDTTGTTDLSDIATLNIVAETDESGVDG